MAGSQANKAGDETFNESWRKVMEMDAAERKKKEATQIRMEEEQEMRIREERKRRATSKGACGGGNKEHS
jgi:hypothetical protein